MPQGYAVLYDKNSDRIYLRNGLDDGVKVFQLTTMEIAHAMMAKDNPDYDRNESHLTAYAASYMLCKQYGILKSALKVKPMNRRISKRN